MNLKESQRQIFWEMVRKEYPHAMGNGDGGKFLTKSIAYLSTVARVDLSYGPTTLEVYALRIYINKEEVGTKLREFFGTGSVEVKSHWRDGQYLNFVVPLTPTVNLEE